MRYNLRCIKVFAVVVCAVQFLLILRSAYFDRSIQQHRGSDQSDGRTQLLSMIQNTILESDYTLYPNNTRNLGFCIHDRNKSIFVDYDVNAEAPVHGLEDDTHKYFRYYGDRSISCLIEGTDHIKTVNASSQCVCKDLWYGPHCAFPEALRHSQLPKFFRIYRRQKPRRIIYAFPFNVEFEMSETRFASIGDLVDEFLIAESNYTAHGDAKPLRFLDGLKAGFCSNLHKKIGYVFIGHFPWLARKIGWIADDLPRDLLGTKGLRKQIRNARHDDLFILTDADELPTREALLFLKLHTGYPEPFGFHMRWTTYGFQWIAGSGNRPILAGSTIGLLNHVFYGKASKVRNAAGHFPKVRVNLDTYRKTGGLVRMWKLGGEKYAAGWHCSWCFRPEQIRIKLISAHNGDYPRWGDYSEKTNVKYIASLVKRGLWFDDRSTLTASDSHDVMYAPPYMHAHYQRFKHILENVY